MVFLKANLIINFIENPENNFKRQKKDLIYLHEISLLDSLLAKSFEIVF